MTELRFALAEADASVPSADLPEPCGGGGLSERSPGWPASPAGRVAGLEAFRRVVWRFDRLLDRMTADEWARPALRDLSVQGLVGHLIGVEEAFAPGLCAARRRRLRPITCKALRTGPSPSREEPQPTHGRSGSRRSSTLSSSPVTPDATDNRDPVPVASP